MYLDWFAQAPQSVELAAMCYPGRGTRAGEPPAEAITHLAHEAADALTASDLDIPLTLFGHSLGALVAYETARLLTRPLTLAVSSCGSAHLPRRSLSPDENDKVLWTQLVELGGISASMARNPLIRALTLPAARADLRINNAYRWAAGPPLEHPVLALAGDTDSLVPVADVQAWQHLTHARLRLHLHPGGHFYLLAALADVLATLTASETGT